MPHNKDIAKREKHSDVLQGETPRTTFKDALNSVQVDLIYWPDERINLAAHAFQKATWMHKPYVPGEDKEHDKELMEQVRVKAFKKKGLPLSLELYDFVFCVSGINRVVTHQIVRNRIGATYSQQASGDKDWRHHDALVPRSIYQEEETYSAFKKRVLNAKNLYADMLDSRKVPILDARKVLPHCLSTFIYVKFNLVTLMRFIRKRDCVQTQEPETVMVARRMREVTLEKFPEMEYLLENRCKKGDCYYLTSDRGVGTSMFVPDKVHDFPYNKDNFIYDKTVHEMVYDLPPVPTENYEGYEKLS